MALLTSSAIAAPIISDRLEMHPGSFPMVTGRIQKLSGGVVNIRYQLDPKACYQLSGDNVPEEARQIERLVFTGQRLFVNGTYVMTGIMHNVAVTGGFNVSFISGNGSGYVVHLGHCFVFSDSFEA
jgi:hypothetical protein